MRTTQPFASAIDYHHAHAGRAIVINRDGQTVFAENADVVRDIESASKTICALTALQMEADTLIPSLDVHVADYIPEFALKTATVRQLLSQTSGLYGGRTGSKPTYAESIAAPIRTIGRFSYGPNHFNVFGEMLKRILKAQGFVSTIEDYIRNLVLPRGVVLDHYDYVAPGQPHLAGGAHMSARSLAVLGEHLRLNVNAQMIAPQTKAPDPLYALSTWLCMDMDRSKPLPARGFAAAGANNQRLLVLPDRHIVCARLGDANSSFSDAEFVARL